LVWPLFSQGSFIAWTLDFAVAAGGDMGELETVFVPEDSDNGGGAFDAKIKTKHDISRSGQLH
jgi:hypothetical protein